MNLLSKNQLKNLAAYRQQKRCDEEGLFVVEGVKLCTEALQQGISVRCLCATADYFEKYEPSTSSVYIVSENQLERLSLLRCPNKVWMLCERPDMEARATDDASLILALDGIQDPGNMGTILRTADWFGIRTILCSNGTVSCFNPKVVQATMGAIFRTSVQYCNLADKVRLLHKQGYSIYGALLDGENITGIRNTSKSILIIGNEGHGISPEVATLVDHRITIPNIGGTCESLNAAIATAIALYQFSCR